MGAAASISGEISREFENFKKIRDEYETKVSAGASDTEIYDHVHSIMRSLGLLKLSLDLLTVRNNCNNCTEDIVGRASANYLSKESSKIYETKRKIETALIAAAESDGWGTISCLSAPCAVVTSCDNFDNLRVPSDHYSRLSSDAYYCDKDILLRTQLSAHMHKIVQGSGTLMYCISGETFRIIEEDEMNSELQHKLEFVRIYNTPAGAVDEDATPQYMNIAETIIKGIINEESKIRWEESDEAFHLIGDAYNDLQVKFGDNIIDVVRGGSFTDEFLTSLGYETGMSGYSLTFDLDHLSMVINNITDIRQLLA